MPSKEGPSLVTLAAITPPKLFECTKRMFFAVAGFLRFCGRNRRAAGLYRVPPIEDQADNSLRRVCGGGSKAQHGCGYGRTQQHAKSLHRTRHSDIDHLFAFIPISTSLPSSVAESHPGNRH